MLEWTVSRGIEVVAVVTDSHLPSSPTMAVAKKHAIPLLSMEEAEQRMEQDGEFADLVVSYLFWRKIRKPLIVRPKYRCINFHPAILPDYRGLAGYNIGERFHFEQFSRRESNISEIRGDCNESKGSHHRRGRSQSQRVA